MSTESEVEARVVAATIIGYTATAIGLLVQLPQVVRTLRSCKFDGLSMKTYMIHSFTSALWITCGILMRSTMLTVSSIPSLTYCLVILGAYCVHTDKCGKCVKCGFIRNNSSQPSRLNQIAVEPT